MTNLVLSDSARRSVEKLQTKLPHSILLTGPSGVGLKTIAKVVAQYNGQVTLVEPVLLTKKSTVPQISVERIRELYTDTRTIDKIGRIIVIDDADAMTLTAQNAFLKLLEEPNDSTYFILTSHRPELLLPTIRSRVETHRISPADKSQMETLFSGLPAMTAQKKAQLSFIAAQLPAELHSLANDEQLFRRRASQIGLAKQLLEASAYKRTALLHQEKIDRSQALGLLEDMIGLLTRNPAPDSPRKITKLLDAIESLAGGGNIKLHLMRAVL